MIESKVKQLSKFTSLLIKKGKKARAFRLVLGSLFFLKKKTKKNPLNLISNVMKTVTPGVTTKKTVIAGRLYHLPCSITANKALYFSCKWLQTAAIENKELQKSSLDVKLAEECLKVLKKKGQSLIFLKQHNKVVSDNRPFLRFVRRKFKPRLPRKVWLKRKQLLWLSRKKKYKPKFISTFDYQLDLGEIRKIPIDNQKYAKKSLIRTSKLLKSCENKQYRILVKKAKIRLKKKRLADPAKYLRIQKLREKIIKEFSYKKTTRYEQRSFEKRKQFFTQNKTTYNKNKFQSRA